LNWDEGLQQLILLMVTNHNGPNTMIYMISVCLVPFIKFRPIVAGCLSSDGKESFVVNNTLHIKTFIQESRMLIILTLLLLFPVLMYSQRKGDIGIFAGTTYYMGDLNPGKHFYLPAYAIGPMYRFNFDPRNSIRLSAIYDQLKGSTFNYGDPYVESLNKNFDATFIDIEANYEINFIPYKTADKKMNRSLYLSAGLGYHLALSGAAQNQFTVPFGIGYKVNLAKKLSAGVELSVKKTFTDKGIDGFRNFGSEKNNLFGNNDWYTFAGIFISYKIFNYREECHAYD
jgi:hypothetical protein